MQKKSKENKWDALSKICDDPKKWLEMYGHYQDLLIQEDAAGFWQTEYGIANAERNELKKKIEAGANL